MWKKDPPEGDTRWNEQERGGYLMSDEMRTCEWCEQPFEGRSDAVYCSRNHKRAASRARQRTRERSNYLQDRVTPSQSSGVSEATRAADARFKAMVEADQASRVPDAQAREWRKYARRHGTLHPDEMAARIAKGNRSRAEDWEQGTQRFQRETKTLAEQAKASREQQRRPMIDAGPGAWDDEDPDLMQPAEMITGSIFKAGYRHASDYR
jgi:hypothetical protein